MLWKEHTSFPTMDRSDKKKNQRSKKELEGEEVRERRGEEEVRE